MATNLERASLVSRSVEIESVTLTQIEMDADLDPQEVPRELRLRQQFRCRYETRESQRDRLFVYVQPSFRRERSPARAGRTPRGRAECNVPRRLSDRGSASFPEDALQYFADLNGTYNVWPYWRELVQTFTGRAGLSGIVIPVFKPPVRPVPIQEELTLEQTREPACAARVSCRAEMTARGWMTPSPDGPPHGACRRFRLCPTSWASSVSARTASHWRRSRQATIVHREILIHPWLKVDKGKDRWLDSWHFRRDELAEQVFATLTHGPAQPLSLSVPRRTGKTEFLVQDLAPHAEARGHRVIYAGVPAPRVPDPPRHDITPCDAAGEG